MEERKCFYQGCSHEADYLCACSAQAYSCKNHLSDHLESSEEDHPFKPTFIRLLKKTKNALIELLKKEKLKKDKLKEKVIALFYKHLQNSESILKDILNKLAADSDDLNKWLRQISSTQKVSKTEQNPFVKLLSLHPDEAVEKAKLLIPKTSESYDSPKLFSAIPEASPTAIEHISNNYETFLSMLSKIEKTLEEYDKSIESNRKLASEKLGNARKFTSDLIKKIEKCRSKLENWKHNVESKDQEEIQDLSSNLSAMQNQIQLKNYLSSEEHLEAAKYQGVILQINPNTVIEIDIKNPIFVRTRDNISVLVLKGKFKDNGIEVAIKVHKSKYKAKLNKYKKEVEILQKLQGRNSIFLEFYGTKTETVSVGNEKIYLLYLITELCDNTLMNDISNRSVTSRYYIYDGSYFNIASSLLEGFIILEKLKIHHKNITPHNILISKTGKLKITGFSNSKLLLDLEDEPKYHKISGKIGYMAPEIRREYEQQIRSKEQRKIEIQLSKASVYSLGLVLFQLYTLPSIQEFNKCMDQNYLNNCIDQFKPIEICKTLKGMLAFDPLRRISLTNALSILGYGDYYRTVYMGE